MADGISTSGLIKVSNITDLDPAQNYMVIDSDEKSLTGRVSFSDFIDLTLRHTAQRLNDSGILPFIRSGVQLSDVRKAITDDSRDFILDDDGNLITDSS